MIDLLQTPQDDPKKGSQKVSKEVEKDTVQMQDLIAEMLRNSLETGIPFRIEFGKPKQEREAEDNPDKSNYEDNHGMSLEAKIAAIVAEVTDPKKDTAAYGYRYATLDQILQILRPIWRKYGVGVIQHPYFGEDGKLHLDTIIMDGKQSINYPSTWPILEGTKMNVVQKIGATITYARRYVLSAIFGMAAEEDTDANETASIPSSYYHNGHGDASKLQALLEQIQSHIENRNLDVSAYLKQHKAKKLEDLNYTAAKDLLKAIYTGQITKKEKGK